MGKKRSWAAVFCVVFLCGCTGGGGSSSSQGDQPQAAVASSSSSAQSSAASSQASSTPDVSAPQPPLPGPILGNGITPILTLPRATAADAARFLEQASFGATTVSVAQVQQLGFSAYLDEQFLIPATGYTGFNYEPDNQSLICPNSLGAACARDHFTLAPLQNEFFVNAVNGDDQLRQRVALALSEIMVVSETSGADIVQPYAMAAYQQILLNDAFGNFRTLLGDITFNPAMGRYLTYVNNDKPNPALGTSANENFAREVLQLFSLGVVELNPDGSPVLDSDGNQIQTYSLSTVQAFARAFTGLTYPTVPGASATWPNPENYLGQMLAVDAHHDTDPKTLLGGTVLSAGQNTITDVNQALDNIFNHQNIGPFISRQLIQFLVTGNPSSAYVARVSAVFNDNGAGVRGDMQAVIKAILLDPVARGQINTDSAFGRLREPAQFLPTILRGVGGSTYSDGVFMALASRGMSQDIFDSPSVFNFFPADYTLQDSSTNEPSFGILNYSSTFNRTNLLSTMFRKDVAADITVPNSTGTHIDTTGWQAAAANPSVLIAKINLVFFHNAMSTALQNLLIANVSTVTANDPDFRVRVAFYLALSSQQFQVEQ